MRLLLLECQYSGVHLGPDGEDGEDRYEYRPAKLYEHGRPRGAEGELRIWHTKRNWQS